MPVIKTHVVKAGESLYRKWVEKFVAHAVAYAIRPEGELHLLSNWRRDNFHDYGERRGKSYFYSAEELGRLAVAAFIARYGIELGAAFRFVRKRKSQIDAETKRICAGRTAVEDYVDTLTLDPFLSDGFSAVTIGKPENIRFDDPPFGTLSVNITLVITRALERAKTYLDNAEASDENE